MALSKEQIISSIDLKLEKVAVPEWGGDVFISEMSGTDRDAYEMSLLVRQGDKFVQDLSNARAKLVARCLVDEDGKRLFTEADIAALGKKSGAVLDRLDDVAKRLNGLEAKAVEDAEKK